MTRQQGKSPYQWATPENRMPFFLPVLTALTGLYLLIELSFASYLVDLLGGAADVHAIERAEHCGRLISGVAVALAVWGFQVPRLARARTPLLKLALFCLMTAGVSVAGVYYGERYLIDEIVNSSPAELRLQAAKAVAVREELFTAEPSLYGISVPSPSLTDDSWNAFRGLFPFLSLFDEAVLERNVGGADAAAAAGAAASVPQHDVFLSEILPSLFDAMESRFDAYRRIADARTRGVERAGNRVRDGWERHVQNLQRLGLVGGNGASRAITNGKVASAREAVQNAGVPVPNSWNVFDQETFQRAAYGTVMPEINSEYNGAVAQIFGRDIAIPPELSSYDAFLSHAEVQRAIRADLGIESGIGFEILPGLDGVRGGTLYEVYAQALEARVTRSYFGSADPFRPGGEFFAMGETAMRALVVPPMALSLSLLGALVHLIKLLNYGLSLSVYGRSRLGIRSFLKKRPRLRFLSAAVAGVLVVSATYTPAAAIVDSEYYREASGQLGERMGQHVAIGVEWTISLQSTVAPAGDVVRLTGIFSPIEAYLVDGAVPSIMGAETADLVPLPRPRPEVMVELAAADVVPLPRPRPDGR